MQSQGIPGSLIHLPLPRGGLNPMQGGAAKPFVEVSSEQLEIGRLPHC